MRRALNNAVGIDEEDEEWMKRQYIKTDKDRFEFKGVNNYQCDLVQLPTEEKTNNKYLFVIINTGTLNMDAEAQQNKEGKTTANSLRTIIRRQAETIKYPIYSLLCDHGSEFYNKDFKSTCAELGIKLLFSSISRKNQTSHVEGAIGELTKPLYMKINDLMRRGHRDLSVNNWNIHIKELIKIINEFRNKEFNYDKKLIKEYNKKSIEGKGTTVYPLLPRPIHPITDEKLYGNFRNGDLKFNPNYESEIIDILYRYGHPLRYVLKLTKNARDRHPESTKYEGYKTSFLKSELKVGNRGNYKNLNEYFK